MEPQAAMSLNDLIELLLAARGRIDFYWNFYSVVVVAVIGWLVAHKKALTRSTRILVTVAYLIAATMNLVGLYGAYTMAEALRLDLLGMAGSAPLANTLLLLQQHSFLPQRTVAILTHVLVGATILFVIWFARFPDEKTGAGADAAAPAGSGKTSTA